MLISQEQVITALQATGALDDELGQSDISVDGGPAFVRITIPVTDTRTVSTITSDIETALRDNGVTNPFVTQAGREKVNEGEVGSVVISAADGDLISES
jgi:hypothetical protein